MLKTIISIVLLSCFANANAQFPEYKWARQFGSSYLEDTFLDNGRSVAVDADGNVYSIGLYNNTLDFDPGPGVYNLPATGFFNQSIYISKLNAAGEFVWAKQIGTYVEGPMHIALDKNANVYVTSQLRQQADMDSGPGVHQITPNGPVDAFLLKLNKNGEFLWVRHFGAAGDIVTSGTTVTVDKDNNVVLAGQFNATVDFDPGAGVNNLTAAGTSETFVVKFTGNGDYLWAKKLGDFSGVFSFSYVQNITCDLDGNIYSTGWFKGACDFDPGPGAFIISSVGDADAFVCKWTPQGNLLWAKSLGAGESNYFTPLYGLATDSKNNVCFFGSFYSPTLDADPGPAEYILTNNGISDVFLVKLNSNGDFIWGKNFGGRDIDYSYDMTIDQSDNIYTIGSFYGLCDFDPGPGTFTLDCPGTNFVLSRFDEDANFKSASLFATGATARQVVTDNAANIYITGHFGGSSDFDPGPGVAVLSEGRGFMDAFVLKLSKCNNVTSSVITVNECKDYVLNNRLYTTSGNYTQTFVNSTGCDSIINLHLTITRKINDRAVEICEGQRVSVGSHSYQTTGIYRDTLRAPSGCDSIVITSLTVNAAPHPDLGLDRNLCEKSSLTVTPGTFNKYLWQDNSISATYTIRDTGVYWVKVTSANQCTAIDTLRISAVDLLPKNFLADTQRVCPANSIQVTVPGFKKYLWSTGATASTITVQQPGTYSLEVTDHKNCTGRDTINIVKGVNCIPFSIPSAFSPDRNGRNDIFKPIINLTVLNYRMAIFNRYGQQIYSTNNPASGWDGNFKGLPQPNGSYIYIIKYTTAADVMEKKGTVLLLR